MTKLKLMTIVGTRPEIIRLSSTIKACDRYFNQVLVHTGQNYDYTLNQVFFDDLELRAPDYYLEAVGTHLGDTMGNIIAKSYEVLSQEQPDALLILGDTNSCLSAVAAKRLKIPVFHMEAGNRCFDQNVPEEINRKIVDHVSDVNLPYTEHSRRYLLDEGFKKENIFVTGSPMKEVLEEHADKINHSDVLNTLNLKPQEYILVSAHREENIDHEDNFMSLMNAINDIAEKYQMPIIYSTHPRSWKKIEERNFKFHPLVKQLKPFGFFDYNALQKNAFVVLSDSGTLSEESSMLKFPGVLIRTSTERPEVLDKGTVIIGGITYENLVQSVEMARTMQNNNEPMIDAIDYKDTNVSIKVVKIIQSYKDIINRNTWRKL
ncbi:MULTISPECIES: UDP-N-acetylglucosamine 2-epimerase (non-hydrolyzing) [Staphylococcus]|uniref:UDP-N-acetylglucosamine 2-epimerase (Non-hydrolyzing) n=1 Tax=Staphylococcus agnetis TaxID=985762 RepID=A0A2T4MIC1_9STAP|nr:MULTISPECIES: UDP-N-acetylglucosamine 2-epimerase (non-hydrolyzing) [Staphylococcus]NHM91687.1 UDP-N-acetylglucosamine 2-epimerase (non-hydrolyzing) [Staphylococcus sp. 10602379]NJI02765.1 UDP-N-acetylglucosamine 2-epimerase (non-hydrolyzing) [Staphylococcus agnetis]NJI12596.1 UDP-N-acetylglucosamine 2-epimerase (non-hydrolyzing) [Staphylococcus agnetis]PTH13726.1 UDP-N-acetylglucosamine 2-epimerase (non-hydrolyzing) [Staphylococcus agnetis]PTH29011.1 UDP-N-acetylglucosamine 2-epimerase (no